MTMYLVDTLSYCRSRTEERCSNGQLVLLLLLAGWPHRKRRFSRLHSPPENAAQPISPSLIPAFRKPTRDTDDTQCSRYKYLTHQSQLLFRSLTGKRNSLKNDSLKRKRGRKTLPGKLPHCREMSLRNNLARQKAAQPDGRRRRRRPPQTAWWAAFKAVCACCYCVMTDFVSAAGNNNELRS